MTTADYHHFIDVYVTRYRGEEDTILKEKYKERLLGYLADYNDAAAREKKRTYRTVKELLIDHSLIASRD